MSALAHYIETAGIATTLVALIRDQAERTRPPRALWVPFELGRPFGAPGEADFQRDVVLATLGLLTREDGPVLLEDYPHEAGNETPDPDWRAPVLPPGADLAAEIEALRPAYARAVNAARRTTVGLVGLDIAEAGAHLAAWAAGAPLPSPRKDLRDIQILRYSADDVRSYFLECAAWTAGRPTSRQIERWFWNETAAGRALEAARDFCLRSEEEIVQTVGGRNIIPRFVGDWRSGAAAAD